MKYTAILLAGAAASIAAPAQAREGQAYIGVNGGISLEDQVDVDLADTDPQTNAAFADTNTGIDADVVIGYDFGAFRLEAEGGYKRNSYDSLTVVNSAILPGGLTVPAGTVVQNEEDLSIWSGMLNGLVEFGKDDGFQVFAGGGVGFANVDLPVEVAGVRGTVNRLTAPTRFLAWQTAGGARSRSADQPISGSKYVILWRRIRISRPPRPARLEGGLQPPSVWRADFTIFGGEAKPLRLRLRRRRPLRLPPHRKRRRRRCVHPGLTSCSRFDGRISLRTPAAAFSTRITAYANGGSARVIRPGHTVPGSAALQYGCRRAPQRLGPQLLTGRGIPDGRFTGDVRESQPRVPTAEACATRSYRAWNT